MREIVVVHGGTNSPPELSDGCERAAHAGLKAILAGGSALEGAVAAVRVMEDDGRFNAGVGSYLRLDGKTIEMDAGVMDSDGQIGAVAAIRGFKHPIDAALAVIDTPHVLLAGEGASRFAALRGLEAWDEPPTEKCLAKHRRAIAMIANRTSRRPAWREAQIEEIWNFEGPLPDELIPNDTVGAVARDRQGRLAAANSTGGAVPMILGRVGDSPLPGAGFWASPHAAIATTGIGEEIIRRLAARAVADRMADGLAAEDALNEVVAEFPQVASFGAVAVGPDSFGVRANRDMASALAVP